MIYLKFNIGGNSFAVPVKYISESIQQSNITRVPKLPEHILGVMNLRGKIVPVLDTRKRMGMKSQLDERKALIEQLKLREQEHINWVKTLESEVLNNKEITVQRDPTLCNFGKWYIPFMEKLIKNSNTQSNSSNVLIGLLKSFDQPHKQIHGVANEADELMKNGKPEEAVQLIEKTKDTTLKQMIKLFASLYDAIMDQINRDIIVIVNYKEKMFGITVDSLDSTLEIDELLEAPVQNDLVQQMSIIDKHPIQILNLESFINEQKKVA